MCVGVYMYVCGIYIHTYIHMERVLQTAEWQTLIFSFYYTISMWWILEEKLLNAHNFLIEWNQPGSQGFCSFFGYFCPVCVTTLQEMSLLYLFKVVTFAFLVFGVGLFLRINSGSRVETAPLHGNWTVKTAAGKDNSASYWEEAVGRTVEWSVGSHGLESFHRPTAETKGHSEGILVSGWEDVGALQGWEPGGKDPRLFTPFSSKYYTQTHQ
jgi:hypothetical protein